MTPAQLAEIRSRAERNYRLPSTGYHMAGCLCVECEDNRPYSAPAKADIRAMLDEVERLQAQVAVLENSEYPRVCEVCYAPTAWNGEAYACVKCAGLPDPASGSQMKPTLADESRIIHSQHQLLQMVNERAGIFDLISWSYANGTTPNHMARMLNGSSPMPDALRLKLAEALNRMPAPAPAVKLTPEQKRALLAAKEQGAGVFMLVESSKAAKACGIEHVAHYRVISDMLFSVPKLVTRGRDLGTFNLTEAGIQARERLLTEGK
jgi:hypothetical protein